jgi:hypothetical protein
MEYYLELKAQTQNNWIGFQLLVCVYLFFSQYAIRQGQRRLERLMPEPDIAMQDDLFVWVPEQDIRNYRVRDMHYSVPKVFPVELARFIKSPSYMDLAEWILEVDAETNPNRRDDIKRAITASAAMHRNRIPKNLVLLDSRTKALWVRLGFDLELRAVDRDFVLSRVPVTDPIEPAQTEDLNLEAYEMELVRVGALILQYSEKGEFPCFVTFLRIITGYRDLSKEQLLNPSTVQSIATAYAVKSGFMIPASYVQCDSLTVLLISSEQSDTVALA